MGECGNVAVRPLTRRATGSRARIEQEGQRGIHRLRLVARGQLAQGALAFRILAHKFRHRLVGAQLRLVEKGRAQLAAAGLEAGIRVARCGERGIDHALTLAAGGVDRRLGTRLGVEQSLQFVGHAASPALHAQHQGQARRRNGDAGELHRAAADRAGGEADGMQAHGRHGEAQRVQHG